MALKKDAKRIWAFQDLRYEFPRSALLMGILNVTPDSFSDGGSYDSLDRAVEQAQQLVAAGADILDIGGESTRPGADPVSAEKEKQRVVPVIEAIADSISIPISIDTTKAEVAHAALQAGAKIVNDISGLTFDEDMIGVCRETGAGVICMHIQGTPQTMQAEPKYQDCVSEVIEWLKQRIKVLTAAGIQLEQIALDPGIGFGKTALHNLQLMQSLPRLQELGRPILIGHSRKRFLKTLLGRDVEERLAGTIGVSIALAEKNVDMLRIHDVAAVRDAIVAWHTIRSSPVAVW